MRKQTNHAVDCCLNCSQHAIWDHSRSYDAATALNNKPYIYRGREMSMTGLKRDNSWVNGLCNAWRHTARSRGDCGAHAENRNPPFRSAKAGS